MVQLDQAEREVMQAILSGADAAACSETEEAAELGFYLVTGEDALATVRFRIPGDDVPRERVLPLAWAPLMVAEGATIDGLRAPDLEAWFWTAMAVAVTERPLPEGLILPESVWRRRLWVVGVKDHRGASGALYAESTTRAGRIGDLLQRALTTTHLGGPAGRVRKSISLLGADAARAATAQATAAYFQGDDGGSEQDGGPPLVEWEIVSFDGVTRRWSTVAASASPGRERGPDRRRARLFAASLSALEEEAFGTGIHSPRAKRPIHSLDAPVSGVGRDGTMTLGDTLADQDQARGVAARLELEELVAQASLTPRELEVLDLRSEDPDITDAEIASLLGLTRGAVSAHWTHARQKLMRARDDHPPEA